MYLDSSQEQSGSWLQQTLNGISHRTHHISKDSCNSCALFLCSIAVSELSPPHAGSGLLAGAEGRSEWIPGLHTWLLWGVFGDPDDPLHLFLSSKGSSQFPVSDNS